MTRPLLIRSLFACALVFSVRSGTQAADRPNVILIVCDDLNDYVEGFGGHPQAHTPNLARLSAGGVSFTQAHCNIPICGPSRASLFTGIYPHHSGCYGFQRWDSYEVLQYSRTLMDHFRANGYETFGTGKLMHHVNRKEWMHFENVADYGPFAFDGKERVAHPDVPEPFRGIGTIDGSFGPLVNLTKRTFPDGKSYRWRTGGWNRVRDLRVDTETDRELTADEINGKWAARKLEEIARKPDGKPFFLGVGFIRPHTPLIVPQRFFDRFPLEMIKLPEIQAGDVSDTHAASVRGDPKRKEPNGPRTNDMGSRLFSALVASYPTQSEALRRFIQAYLASVASVDELIGEIIDVVDRTALRENTIIIVTSDHGWGMGEKDYLYKNSLWQESTRVPLIVRAPGLAKAGAICERPVSLIDLYPTLIDLCDLRGDTKKNAKGRSLDGHSLEPLLADPVSGKWSGPDAALTALYKWARIFDPAKQSYSLRAKNWRYIRYSNGKEELYHTKVDAHEWKNLASDPAQSSRLVAFREKLRDPQPPARHVPPQMPTPPKSEAPQTQKEKDAEAWKNRFFKKHPAADANRDGKLSWYELKVYREKL